MTSHEGVSCNYCGSHNFRGRRYKCLICYDFDLCSICYESKLTTEDHRSDHPMQCIIPRSDFELYYGGEDHLYRQQSYTCPYCNRKGLSELGLVEHVNDMHTEVTMEVLCPICATQQSDGPAISTDDLASHLALYHRADEQLAMNRISTSSRRSPHTGRVISGPRSRRTSLHFGGAGNSSTANAGPGHDLTDPLAEILQQLSGGRRGGPQSSQLQQLQMQIQMERHQMLQPIDRSTRRLPHALLSSSNSSNVAGIGSEADSSQSIITFNVTNSREAMVIPMAMVMPTPAVPSTTSTTVSESQDRSLLQPIQTTLSETEQNSIDQERADRSQFVQALIVATISKNNG